MRLRVSSSARHRIALASFVLAFALRLIWATRVQSPLAAVYSDMGGYVSRAEALLSGTMPSDPRVLAIWPWGTHAIVAAELALFGRTSANLIGIVHALVGAIPAACMPLLAARLTKHRVSLIASGLLVACWHPLFVFVGFFSSEIWFGAAIALGSLLFVRTREGRRGALGAGACAAVAFLVRPQAILTCVLIAFPIFSAAVYHAIRFRRLRRGSMRSILATVALLLPLGIAVLVSAVRYHRLTGQIGLIASYEPLQRLFGETDVGKVESRWVAPNGDPWSFWFAPHSKVPVRPENVFVFDGFITDARKLEAERQRRLRDVPWTARVARGADNIALLAVRNAPWPEDDFRRIPFRAELQRVFGLGFLALLPFALLGLRALRRHRAAALIIAAHFATLLFVATRYVSETRYRVPYDSFFLLLVVLGVEWTTRGILGRRSRSMDDTSTIR